MHDLNKLPSEIWRKKWLIITDWAYKSLLSVKKGVRNVYVLQLSFHFAYHRWWLGRDCFWWWDAVICRKDQERWAKKMLRVQFRGTTCWNDGRQQVVERAGHLNPPRLTAPKFWKLPPFFLGGGERRRGGCDQTKEKKKEKREDKVAISGSSSFSWWACFAPLATEAAAAAAHFWVWWGC